MKYLLPLLILIYSHKIKGVLEWKVIGKVTDYGQNVTLLCKVPNCCPKDAGWDRWTPRQRTLFIDVKTGRSNKKYDGKVQKDGYTLIIQNLTKNDLNVSYSCLYGVTLGERKFLQEEDVFTSINQKVNSRFSEAEIVGIIVGGIVLVSVAVLSSLIYIWRNRHNKTVRDKATVETKPLINYPGRPNDLKVSKIDASEITIEWGPPSAGDGSTVEDYKIYIKSENTGEKWKYVETVGGSKNDYTFTHLKANDKYYIGVAASNEGCDSPIAETDKTYSLKERQNYPGRPNDLKVSKIDASEITIEWGPPSAGDGSTVEDYKIYIKSENTGEKWKYVETVGGSKNDYTFTHLKANDKYYIGVAASNEGGDSTIAETDKTYSLKERQKKASIDEINTCMKAIESGSEDRQYIRIQVIGKDRVGKTSLVHRLLGYEKHDGKSTDGVEVNRKCQIKKENGEWIVGKDDTKKQEMIRRIRQTSHGKQKEHNPVSNPLLALSKPAPCLEKKMKPNAKEIIQSTSHLSNTGKENLSAKTDTVKTDEQPKINDEKNNISVVSLDNSENDKSSKAETLKSSEEIKKTSNGKYTKLQEQMPDPSSLSLSNQNYVHADHADKITEAMIAHMGDIISEAQSEKDKMTSEGLVECGIWDFAGQKDYYATHQTFFTPHAIYILVADITDEIKDIQEDADFDVIGEYIEFWFDSIHCFCTNPSEIQKLRPPVLMVCTGIDKVDKIEDRKREYDQNFRRIIGKHKKINHNRGIFYTSNEYPDQKEIESLKKKIWKIAEEMNYFSEKRPTRWINLENTLEVLKDMGEKVYSWRNIVKLAHKNSIEEEELLIFLNYHHKIGNIIFFEDKSDYIILQPNWLVKCFRCLICDDEKIEHSLHTGTEMYKLENKGELSETLIGELFKKETDLNFEKYKPHILDVMEKFDIIVKPQFSTFDNNLYYMPCMIVNSGNLIEIKANCFTPSGHCTPWLVLEFEFLPVAYYNHIMYDYIRQYKVCEVESGLPAIYKGKAVVYLDESESKMLIICFSKNAISLQVWEWQLSDANAKLYENILRQICDKIDKFEKKLIHNLHYTIKSKCSIGDYSQSSGRISYEELTSRCKETDEYNCKDPKHKGDWHNKNEIENTWLKYATAIESEMLDQKKKRAKEREDLRNKREKEDNADLGTEQEEVIPKNIRDIEENVDLETEQEEVIPKNIRDNDNCSDLKDTLLGKTTVQKEQKDTSDQKEKKEKLEIKQNECIPQNIRDQIQRQIEDWEKKDELFVSTRASDYIMECLQNSNCLTITAPSGAGKSFIAIHTVLVLRDKGYNIIPVIQPSDIRDYYQPGKPTVFIVDDICGNFTANQQQIENWKQQLPVINMIIADKCCKIIVSCRLQVYNDDKFNTLLPFKSYECNLISDKLCLTSIEKQSIASKYIGTGFADLDKLSENSDLFPLLCSLYNEKNHGDVNTFFNNPYIVYEKEIENLSMQGDEGKCKKSSLALLVIFNNQLREKLFQGRITNEQTQIIKDTCEACGINSIPKINLKRELNTLVGTFVSIQDGIYRSIHDKLFDILAYYFGQTITECLIEHGESELVHERFIWQTSPNDENSNIDFIIEISDAHSELYLERFIKDWLAGKVAVVFSNTNMKVSSFRQQLIQYLQQLDKLQQVKIANIKDTVEPMESCNSGTTPLVWNCYDGYTDMVQWLLHNDVDVDQCRDNGTSGLFMASHEGHTDIVKLLLERNPDVNLCDKDGWRPLLQASDDGHTDIVKLLLEKNPDVNLCDNDGRSPLLQASEKGHTDIVQLLLERNPDVNLCDNDGFSPLLRASDEGHTDIVKLLLERNPDVNLCDNDGYSPLLQASQYGHTDIVKLLLERNADVNLCNKYGSTPLIQASMCGHTDIVRLLLERNPVPCDNTSLSTSYVNNNISISNSPSLVQPLMKHKPDINAQSYDGGSALYFSALDGNLEITQLLLENNADSNICIYSKQYIAEMMKNHPTVTLRELKQNIFDTLVKRTASRVTEYVSNKSVDYAFDVVAGSSPLHIACFMGMLDVVCCLLDSNANINITKEDGTTPLFYSCEVGHEDIVRLLLDKEAETKICRLDGKSPLKIAIDNKHTAIVEIVTEHIHRTEPLL